MWGLKNKGWSSHHSYHHLHLRSETKNAHGKNVHILPVCKCFTTIVQIFLQYWIWKTEKQKTVPSVQFTVSDWCDWVTWVMVQNIYNQFWNISYRFYSVARTYGTFQKSDTDLHTIQTYYSNLFGICYISDDCWISSGMWGWRTSKIGKNFTLINSMCL